MSGNDASTTDHRLITAQPSQPRWERLMIGRVTTVPQAWARFALNQVVVACILWGAFVAGAATWWQVVAVAVVVLAEVVYTWAVVDAYRYRR